MGKSILKPKNAHQKFRPITESAVPANATQPAQTVPTAAAHATTVNAHEWS